MRRSNRPLPVIVLANWYQFGGGKTLVQPRVQSRMLLWCKSGKGSIEVNGQRMALGCDDYAWLPWGRRMVYRADPRDPLAVGGIHLIPWHDAGVPVVFEVEHSRESAPAKHRRDLPLQQHLRGIVSGNFARARRLHLLAEYTVEVFQANEPDENEMRRLADQLLRELDAALGMGESLALPPPLRVAHEFARAHLGERLSMGEWARAVSCSRSTLQRLFRRCQQTTPGEWLIGLRIQTAKHLLRSTSARVGEVARQVGIEDPYYFSRLFRKRTGLCPREFRGNRHGL